MPLCPRCFSSLTDAEIFDLLNAAVKATVNTCPHTDIEPIEYTNKEECQGCGLVRERSRVV